MYIILYFLVLEAGQEGQWNSKTSYDNSDQLERIPWNTFKKNSEATFNFTGEMSANYGYLSWAQHEGVVTCDNHLPSLEEALNPKLSKLTWAPPAPPHPRPQCGGAGGGEPTDLHSSALCSCWLAAASTCQWQDCSIPPKPGYRIHHPLQPHTGAHSLHRPLGIK